MNKHIRIIGVQALVLAVIGIVLFALYPKAEMELNGNFVKFRGINSNVIIISENPDFSNPRYFDVSKGIEGENGKEMSFELAPGKYYWKSSNGYIEGLEKQFEIKSEVGMKIERECEGEICEENESELVNVGNVKINVTQSKEGIMVGHIILEPDQSQQVEDKPDEVYEGGQTG